jgi:hypothetical protein
VEPVDRKHHNHVYKSPDPSVGDLSGYAVEGAFSSNWRPNSEELAVLVEGGDIELTVFAQPVPPVSLAVMAGEDHSPLPSDPESQEVVEVGGQEWRVPPAVAAEVKSLQQGVVDKLTSMEIKPTDTVIVTIPDDAGPEMTQGILAALSKQFPENRACVLPESLGLHTRETFVELLQAGAEMAENIASDPGKALAAAQKWRGLVGQE